MNMLNFDKKDIQQQERPFIAEAVFAVEAVSAEQQSEKQVKAKQLLDTYFPIGEWVTPRCIKLRDRLQTRNGVLQGRHTQWSEKPKAFCGVHRRERRSKIDPIQR